jgi:DNA-directed RNA polymerase subunit K/omega
MAKRKEKTVEDLGPFQLTSLLIRRTRELMNGSPALVEVDSSEPVQTAFEEHASGKLSITEEDVTID